MKSRIVSKLAYHYSQLFLFSGFDCTVNPDMTTYTPICGKRKETPEKNCWFTVYFGDPPKKTVFQETTDYISLFDKVQDGCATRKEKDKVKKILDTHHTQQENPNDEHDDSDNDSDDEELKQFVFTFGNYLKGPTNDGAVNPATFTHLHTPATIFSITAAAGFFDDEECKTEEDDDTSGPYTRPFRVVVQDTMNSHTVDIPGHQVTRSTFNYLSTFMAEHVYKNGRLYNKKSKLVIACPDVEVWKFQAMKQFALSFEVPPTVRVTSLY